MDFAENGFVLCARSVSENPFGEQSHFLIPLAILVMNWDIFMTTPKIFTLLFVT